MIVRENTMIESQEELLKLLESAITKITLSSSNPRRNLPEQENYLKNRIKSFDKKFNSSNQETKIAISEACVELVSLYWDLLNNYLELYRDSKNQIFIKEYRNRAHEFDGIVDSLISRFEKQFDTNSGKIQVAYGQHLVHLYMLKLDVSKYLWQQPSPEYMSIFSKVNTILGDMKGKIK